MGRISATTFGVQGILSVDIWVSGGPGKVIQGGGNDYNQPPGTLCTPSHAGDNSNIVVG